mmetsp:Transcript_26105/g.77253  ORF Transcript_26105/g.77253 Transcript_26105/m.77253 type:complete len:581 (-) Transcript_26105:1626-3368(-)
MCKKPDLISTEVHPKRKTGMTETRRRRSKRDKQATVAAAISARRMQQEKKIRVARRKSVARKKHESDAKSGGVEALIPSLIGMSLLVVVVMAKMGFRGRANVAGIDLGTTNSVVCVQAPAKSVGDIECIPDPSSGSPIVPSVVSFLDHINLAKPKNPTGDAELDPHPSNVVVGSAAKARIDTHPHHTLYHAKRVIGRSFSHETVHDLVQEVEFEVVDSQAEQSRVNDDTDDDSVRFRVPYHAPDSTGSGTEIKSHLTVKPQQVGSYIVNHLIQMTKRHLGHDNVRSAVIAIPAKFDQEQRIATIEAFKNAGITVARVLEEPTAAALAYGLDKKDGVNHIMVYDFGGGTLDVSILHVSDGGYVDVMGSDGDDRLGGADFDSAVAHFLLGKDGGDGAVARVASALKAVEKRLQQEKGGTDLDAAEDLEEILAEACPVLEVTPACTLSSFHTIGEKLKIALSDHPSGGGVAMEQCLGLRASAALPGTVEELCALLQPVQLTLTSSEYDNAVGELYQKSMLPIRRLLADLNLETDEIDEVVMVGGTTRMPMIRELVRKELGVPSLNTHIDPDLTVAYGAASVID